MHAIETVNLEAHVSLCEERYMALQKRFEDVEHKIDDLAETIQDIHEHVHSLSAQQSDRWTAIHVGTIGVLMTIIGFMASMLWG
jgi:predicted  nucleic acid-binding Zn-ribbon protein